jgi:hypothetical protein
VLVLNGLTQYSKGWGKQANVLFKLHTTNYIREYSSTQITILGKTCILRLAELCLALVHHKLMHNKPLAKYLNLNSLFNILANHSFTGLHIHAQVHNHSLGLRDEIIIF